ERQRILREIGERQHGEHSAVTLAGYEEPAVNDEPERTSAERAPPARLRFTEDASEATDDDEATGAGESLSPPPLAAHHADDVQGAEGDSEPETDEEAGLASEGYSESSISEPDSNEPTPRKRHLLADE